MDFNYLQVDVESGVGLETGQGEDPQLMLRVSKDSGHHFTNERWLSAGKVGEYNRRAKWYRLGDSRTWTFRIRATDPVKWIIIQAIADVDAYVD